MLETFSPSNSSIKDLLLNAANGRGVQVPTSLYLCHLVYAGKSIFLDRFWVHLGTREANHLLSRCVSHRGRSPCLLWHRGLERGRGDI